MHIPDNYLSPSTCAVMGAAMVPIWVKTVDRVKKEVTRERLPLLGIGAAISFMLMMFNVPLPGGTTGHAVGGTLLAILLGPAAACISVTVALLIQALIFGDGGVLAFGANCFNMAFVLPFVGYTIFKFLKGRFNSESGEYISAVIASYIAINAAALFAAIEFGIQPLLFRDAAGMPLYCPYPLSVSIPAMLIPHLAVAGVVEAIFTGGIYGFIKKVSPGIIYKDAKSSVKPVYGLLTALICLSPLGLLAAGTAWGEWGSDEISSVVSGGSALGFVPKGIASGFNFNAMMPDYSVGGLPEPVGYILSAVAGVALSIIIFKLISSLRSEN